MALIEMDGKVITLIPNKFEDLGKNGDIDQYSENDQKIIRLLISNKSTKSRKILRTCFNYYTSTNRTQSVLKLN